MSLLRFLRFSQSDQAPDRQTPLLAAITQRLDTLPRPRAEFVAAFAGLLGRVAYADLEISESEQAVLPRLVSEHAGLAPEEAETVAEIVVHRATALSGIDYASLTRIMNEVAGEQEKKQLIDCLYAIATTDDTVSVAEDETIRAVSRALLLSHAEFIAARQPYKDKLEVLQAARALRRV